MFKRKKKSKDKSRAKRQVFIHGYLLTASTMSLHRAANSQSNMIVHFHHAMDSMLHSAFCLEAYLNYLGKRKFQHWNKVERGMTTRAKLEFLAALIEYDLDFSRRPFQTFTDLQKFRNMIVHGKLSILEADVDIVDLDKMPIFTPEELQAEWEKMCTLANAKRFNEDVEAMMEAMQSAAGLSVAESFFMTGREEFVTDAPEV